MKKLDIDLIKLKKRVCELERKSEPKKPNLPEVVVYIILLGLCVYGMHYCLVAIGVGSAL